MSATIALTELTPILRLKQDKVVAFSISVILTTLRAGFVPEND